MNEGDHVPLVQYFLEYEVHVNTSLLTKINVCLIYASIQVLPHSLYHHGCHSQEHGEVTHSSTGPTKTKRKVSVMCYFFVKLSVINYVNTT